VSYHGEIGEGAHRNTRIEPGSGKGRSPWTASSRKTGPNWVCKGLVDLSTMSHGSTLDDVRVSLSRKQELTRQGSTSQSDLLGSR
jgi:hypothetical protein